jgi:hypothetical protein
MRMSRHRHLLSIVGLLAMTGSLVAGQVTTSKPGASVERHLPGEPTPREWSIDSTTPKDPRTPEDVKRVKVCRV